MEEDEETSRAIPPWVELEYAVCHNAISQHMRLLAGPNAQIHFTHLSKASCDSLDAVCAAESEQAGKAKASFHTASLVELMKKYAIPISKVCLLDPKAEKALSPEDGDGEFEWFLFGGILGDDPPRDRTSELRSLGFPNRHLGPVQMTTDTALGVTKLVVHDKKQLEAIPYVEFPTIRFNSKESVQMPFKYIANGSEPILPPGMRELLHEDLNKSFDF